MIHNTQQLPDIQKKAGQALAAFLVVMVLLTVLSRAAANIITPVVTCSTPKKASLEYEVTASGNVKEKQQQAVNTVPGILVKEVFVSEGDYVSGQEVLFELDLEDLEEKIQLKNQEIEKLELGFNDSKERSRLEQQEKSREQSRAEEDYSRAEESLNAQVQRAFETMTEAQNRLEEFDSGGTKETRSNADSREELQKISQEKHLLLEQAEMDVKQKKELLEQARMDKKSQEILEKLEKDADESEKAVQLAREECSVADKALEDWNTKTAGENQSSEEQRQALADACTQAQNAYEDALRQREEGLAAAQRKIEDAKKPTAPDSTPKITQIEMETLKAELDKYTALREVNGQILAPANGIVRQVSVKTGSPTTEGSSITLADLASGCRYTASLPKEQAELISKDDKIALKSADGKKVVEDLTINSVGENKENPDLVDITVDMNDGEFGVDEKPLLYAEKKSALYSCVVPLEALHMEQNQYFVLMVQETENILGKELTAVRINVEVLEKNSTMAALKDDVLDGNSQIILSSQKTVKAGDRIRLEEE